MTSYPHRPNVVLSASERCSSSYAQNFSFPASVNSYRCSGSSALLYLQPAFLIDPFFHSDQIIVELLYRNHVSFRTLCASPRWAYSFAQCVSYFSWLLSACPTWLALSTRQGDGGYDDSFVEDHRRSIPACCLSGVRLPDTSVAYSTTARREPPLVFTARFLLPAGLLCLHVLDCGR